MSSTKDVCSKTLRSKLNNPVGLPEFNVYAGLDEVLSGVGLTTADSGGKITFYGKDPDRTETFTGSEQCRRNGFHCQRL